MPNVPEERSAKIVLPNPLIMNFDAPHEEGSICAPPCKQCGETREAGIVYLLAGDGPIIDPVAFLIIKKVPYSEYVKQCTEYGSETPGEDMGCNYLVEVLD